MFSGKAKLVIDPVNITNKHLRQSSWKKVAILKLNDDTDLYYKWLIERRFLRAQGVKSETDWINRSLRGSHITIINDRFNDDRTWNWFRNKFNGLDINFTYDPINGLRNNGQHIYIKVVSEESQLMRDILNLGNPYYGFHLTIGHVSDENISKFEHNNYVQKYMIKNDIRESYNFLT